MQRRRVGTCEVVRSSDTKVVIEDDLCIVMVIEKNFLPCSEIYRDQLNNEAEPLTGGDRRGLFARPLPLRILCLVQRLAVLFAISLSCLLFFIIQFALLLIFLALL